MNWLCFGCYLCHLICQFCDLLLSLNKLCHENNNNRTEWGRIYYDLFLRLLFCRERFIYRSIWTIKDCYNLYQTLIDLHSGHTSWQYISTAFSKISPKASSFSRHLSLLWVKFTTNNPRSANDRWNCFTIQLNFILFSKPTRHSLIWFDGGAHPDST